MHHLKCFSKQLLIKETKTRPQSKANTKPAPKPAGLHSYSRRLIRTEKKIRLFLPWGLPQAMRHTTCLTVFFA